MELLERSDSLQALQAVFVQVMAGRGQTVVVAGEAGIGKTALIRKFLKDQKIPYLLLQGYCDSLYAARPLGPLFDIAPQLDSKLTELLAANPGRDMLFPAFTEALDAQTKPVILFFEDIQWADTGTLDFVRFVARRIAHLQCMFIVTVRDTELPPGHPYLTILGELPPTDYRKLQLSPLSLETVSMLASDAGRDGNEIFRLTAGVPYYVSEVLASYHNKIPETVRDSILSLFHRQFDQTKVLWEKISVIPGRIELDILSHMHPAPTPIVDFCYRAGIIIDDGHSISFKHELFRKAIEESLSPQRQRELHKLVVDAMLQADETTVPVARIVHHARLASDHPTLQKLAPRAAEEASLLGSHQEAVKLYKLALEHTHGLSEVALADLYEKYSYECYLTNQVPAAIQALEEVVRLIPEDEHMRRGSVNRHLSRLEWFAGDIQKARAYGMAAVGLCSAYPQARETALAYGNMSQLAMLNDDHGQALEWGEKAMQIGQALDDPEVLCHASNNIGMTLMKQSGSYMEGDRMLRKSLSIALEHQFHEHAARAYANLGFAHIALNNYEIAGTILREGIAYCDTRDLDIWLTYLQSSLASLYLKTGEWEASGSVCLQLLQLPRTPAVVQISLHAILHTIRIRRGEVPDETLAPIIEEAVRIGELQRMAPLATVILEGAWLGMQPDHNADALVNTCLTLLREIPHAWYLPEVSYWVWKCGDDALPGKWKVRDFIENASQAMGFLDQINPGNPYLEALRLSEGHAEDQREALSRLRELGATRSAERIEAGMRDRGILNIPRGPRESTLNNPAGLTKRQMDVLNLLSEGLQNKEIAGQLFVSAKTVDNHISAILSKLDVHSRSKAVARARELGLL